MPESDDSDRIAFLTGEMHALHAVVQALCVTHPDHAMLLRDVQANLQVGLAKIESQPVPDVAVRGYQWMADELLRAIPKAQSGNG